MLKTFTRLARNTIPFIPKNPRRASLNDQKSKLVNTNRLTSQNTISVGIDLGTTNSCIAYSKNRQVNVIANEHNQRITPSIVNLSNATPVIGLTAKQLASLAPDKTLFATKRLIGKKYDDVKYFVKSLPYKVVKASNGDAVIKVNDKIYSPVEIASQILRYLKDTASKRLGVEVKDAVITVPAYFNESQRHATKLAGTMAGLNVLRIINEPTAAALAYGMDKINKNIKTIAVFDLGGGTFDISILELNNGIFEVKATNGDSSLGGEDFDARVQQQIVNQIEKELNISVKDDISIMQNIRQQAEKAKIVLSDQDSYEFTIPCKDKLYRYVLTYDAFEKLVQGELNRLIEPCLQCLTDSGYDKEQIDEVILVGGMTRCRAVRKTVKAIFNKEPKTSVDPDEAVALGAAIQAEILTGKRSSDVLLLDVTPLSLGIETMGGVFTKLINRNSTIPCEKSSMFTSAVDNQKQVIIRIYQGERPMVADNKYLGELTLDNLPPAPRGVPQINVSFKIDADGLLNVSAIDQRTQQKKQVKVKSDTGLTEDEVFRIIQDAESNKTSDHLRKEITLKQQELTLLIGTAEEFLVKAKHKLSEAEFMRLTDLLASAKNVMNSNNYDEIMLAKQLLADAFSDVITQQ